MKQKIFELNWIWHEDYMPWLFFHENKTEKDFKKDVNFLLKKYGKDYIKSNEDSWVGACGWFEFIVPKMSELGYEKVSTIKYGHFGSYIIKNDEIYEKEESRNLKKFIGKELLEEAVEHNKKVEDDMNKRLEQ